MTKYLHIDVNDKIAVYLHFLHGLPGLALIAEDVPGGYLQSGGGLGSEDDLSGVW